MMENKRRFRATIAGKEYTIVGNRSATHLNQVVELVNQQLDQLTELAPMMSQADRAVLMAVNAVSDQLVKEQRIAELEAELARLQQGHGAAKQTPHGAATPSVTQKTQRGSENMRANRQEVPFTRRANKEE